MKNNYSLFVFPDRLISPINGKSYRRVNSQNIKSFGFDSVEDLLAQYSDFPLICDDFKRNHAKKVNYTLFICKVKS